VTTLIQKLQRQYYKRNNVGLAFSSFALLDQFSLHKSASFDSERSISNSYFKALGTLATPLLSIDWYYEKHSVRCYCSLPTFWFSHFIFTSWDIISNCSGNTSTSQTQGLKVIVPLQLSQWRDECTLHPRVKILSYLHEKTAELWSEKSMQKRENTSKTFAVFIF